MSRARHKQATDSDTDSEDGASPVTGALYTSLQLRQALQRPDDYAVAAAELAAALHHAFGRCSKAVQAMMAQDVALAVQCCDTRLQSRAALAGLIEVALRCLPQARRKELQRAYKRSSVQLQRRARRSAGEAGSGAAGSDGEWEGEEPAAFSHLPLDVMAHVLCYLDPVTLARAACVSREWRHAAYADALWQPHCTQLLRGKPVCRAATNAPARASAGTTGSEADGGTGHGGARQQFAADARRHPGRLLRWRTNRVAAGRRLGWLAPGLRLQPGWHHVGTPTVLSHLLSGGGRLSSGSPGDGSSSGGDSSNEAQQAEVAGGCSGATASLSGRLKFWQL